MTLDEFITKWNGKGIDFDNYYGFQCMDLYRQYVKECLGLLQSPPVAGAKDVWTTYLKEKYDRFDNTPSAVPIKGDIMIWGAGAGPYGHIAVCTEANINDFKSFDQNWPVNSLCHIQPHNYTNVLGWLRAKAIVQPVVPNDMLRIDLEGLQTALETYGVIEIAVLKSKLTAKDQTLKSNEMTIDNLSQNYDEIYNRNLDLDKKLIEIKNILFSRGFWFIKYNKIKKLLS